MNEQRDPVFATLDRLIREESSVRSFRNQPPEQVFPPEPEPEPVRRTCSQLLSPQQKRRLLYLARQGRTAEMATEKAEYIEVSRREDSRAQRAANRQQERRKKP